MRIKAIPQGSRPNHLQKKNILTKTSCRLSSRQSVVGRQSSSQSFFILLFGSEFGLDADSIDNSVHILQQHRLKKVACRLDCNMIPIIFGTCVCVCVCGCVFYTWCIRVIV